MRWAVPQILRAAAMIAVMLLLDYGLARVNPPYRPGIAAALVVAIVASWRATPYPFLQYLLHEVNRFFAQIVWRGEVVGSIDLPRTQGAVIVSNHRSGIDPLLIQLSSDLRIIHWMVAREYFFMPAFSIIFKGIECIPVNRGGVDTAATKMAIRFAREGELVGFFPEGQIGRAHV